MARDRLLVIAISCLCAVAAVTLYGDIGLSWDESVQATYGELSLAYFQSGFTDRRSVEYIDLGSYGPLFEMVAAFFHRDVPDAKYEVRHLVFGLAGAALPLVVGLGPWRRLGPHAGVLAALACVATPRLVAVAFNDSKTLCLTICFALFMSVLTETFRREDVADWRRVALLGGAAGLTLCARPAIAPVLLAFAVMAVALRVRSQATWPTPFGMAQRTLATLLVAWLIVVTPWPWAHANLSNSFRALFLGASIPHHPLVDSVLFEGASLQSDSLPGRYLAEMVLLTVPSTHLGLALIGVAATLRSVWIGDRDAAIGGLVFAWIFAPVVGFAVIRPDALILHFTFILTGVAILAGVGASVVVRIARQRPAAIALGVLLTLAPLAAVARLHPYSCSYYNVLAGGTASGVERFGHGCSAAAYREAAGWINATSRGRPTVVIGAVNNYIVDALSSYLDNNVRLKATFRRWPDRVLPLPADFYVGMTDPDTSTNFPDAPVVHQIERDGVVFVVIKGR